MVYHLIILLSLLFLTNVTIAQDSSGVMNARLVSSYLSNVRSKAEHIDQKLDKYTDKSLSKVLNDRKKAERKIMASAQYDSGETKIDRVINFPDRFITRIRKKSSTMEDRLTKQTEKYLNRLTRRE